MRLGFEVIVDDSWNFFQIIVDLVGSYEVGDPYVRVVDICCPLTDRVWLLSSIFPH